MSNEIHLSSSSVVIPILSNLFQNAKISFAKLTNEKQLTEFNYLHRLIADESFKSQLNTADWIEFQEIFNLDRIHRKEFEKNGVECKDIIRTLEDILKQGHFAILVWIMEEYLCAQTGLDEFAVKLSEFLSSLVSEIVDKYSVELDDSKNNEIPHPIIQVFDSFALFLDHGVVRNAIEIFFKNLLEGKKIHFDPSAIKLFCRGCLRWIQGSQYPVHAALNSSLYVSELYEKIQSKHLEDQISTFNSLAIKLTKSIIIRLESASSKNHPEELKVDFSKTLTKRDVSVHFRRRESHQNLIEEEIKKDGIKLFHYIFNTSDGRDTVIEILIQKQNDEYLSDFEINRIVQKAWNAEENISTRLKYFHSPANQYAMNCLALLLYVVFFLSHVYISENDVFSEFALREYFIYFGALSFEIELALKMLKSKRNIFHNLEWALIHIFFDVSIFCTGFVRMLGISGIDVDRNALNLSYIIFMSSSAILLCFKSFYLLRITKALGNLVEILLRVAIPIFRFFILVIGIHIGFSVGFFFLLRRDKLTGYSDFFQTFYTLLKAFLSSVDSKEFVDPAISSTRRVFMQLFFSLYMLLFAIILFNFLIALMTSLYNRMHSCAEKEYRIFQNHLVFEYSTCLRFAPAPFTLFALIFGFLVFLCRILIAFFMKARAYPKSLQFMHDKFCSFCLCRFVDREEKYVDVDFEFHPIGLSNCCKRIFKKGEVVSLYLISQAFSTMLIVSPFLLVILVSKLFLSKIQLFISSDFAFKQSCSRKCFAKILNSFKKAVMMLVFFWFFYLFRLTRYFCDYLRSPQ
jgi:hypothetical protein